MKISVKWLPVESSKLQDHKQQSYVIRNMKVESMGSHGIIRSQCEHEHRQERAVITDTGMNTSVGYDNAA